MPIFTPVVILEVAPPFRKLTLAGRNAPKPIKVGGQQNAIQTWYPGTNKASVQVMGTQEDDIIMEGRWDDPAGSLFPDKNPLGATVRIKVARGLMQGQQLCQLLWGTTIVRQGRVKRFEILYQKKTRTEYRIVFAVDQANEAIALGPLPILNIDVGGAISILAAAAATATTMKATVNAVGNIGGKS